MIVSLVKTEKEPQHLGKRTAPAWLTADPGLLSDGHSEKKQVKVWAEPWGHEPDPWRMVWKWSPLSCSSTFCLAVVKDQSIWVPCRVSSMDSAIQKRNTELFWLEKTTKIIESNRSSSIAKHTTKPCPQMPQLNVF